MAEGDWRAEFGEVYEVPGFIEHLERRKLIKDLSHHNDVAPSFGVIRTEEGNEYEVRLWIDHPIQGMRDMPHHKRYMLTMGPPGETDLEVEFDELDAAVLALLEGVEKTVGLLTGKRFRLLRPAFEQAAGDIPELFALLLEEYYGRSGPGPFEAV